MEPYLRIEALYILEAIAATIYADRVHGLRNGKCKQCLKLFKIESDHDQKFCPAPAHLKEQPLQKRIPAKAAPRQKEGAAGLIRIFRIFRSGRERRGGFVPIPSRARRSETSQRSH
jgi:hypothetical protein